MDAGKDAYWFQHDSNAQHDERILELRSEYGWEGYGLFWALIEKMRDSPDYRLSMATLGGLAAGMGVLKPLLKGIIDLACQHGLFALEGEAAYFYAPTLRRRMSAWDEKKAALSEAGKRGAERKKAKKEQATLKPPLSDPGTFASTVDKSRIEQSSNEDVAPAPVGFSSAKMMAVATTDPQDEQPWHTGPLTKPLAFQAICERLGFIEIDYEHYRKQAYVSAEDGQISRTIAQWNSWVRNYLNNQLKHGPLLKRSADLPALPTPKSEWPERGKERSGQIIYIAGVPGAEELDRLKVATYQNYWPTGVVVSLAFPKNARYPHAK